MATYVIGDLQGCLKPLQRLLDSIGIGADDRLWFTGDLVNRGPDSLGALRFVKQLGAQAITVLGNHDLHLLTIAAGHGRMRPDDTLNKILTAPDREELLEWLRSCPMLHREGDYCLVHAGLLPGWTVDEAQALANEVEVRLRSKDRDEFFAQLYGSKPDAWDDKLEGMDRLRVIVNAMTRMRFCSAEGKMEFQTKGEVAAAPAGFMPWFDVPGRRSADHTLIFGHWSALGLLKRENLLALDTGCVWGSQLTAVRLEDRAVFQCDCATAR